MKETTPSQASSTKTFEQQCYDRFHIEVNGEQLEFVDISPQETKTEVPVLIAPGYGETPVTFRPLLQTLYDEHRRAIAIEHPRNRGDMGG